MHNRKYGFLMFLPKFLYHQFKYFFNFYYLLMVVSQFVPKLKIGFLFTYLGPLSMVLILSLIGELRDEFRRAAKDWETNRRKVKVLTVS